MTLCGSNLRQMLSSSGIVRWGVHLLCGWLLLATLGGVASAPRLAYCSQTFELAAAVAPMAVDFSDTALQQQCQCLVKADQQFKAYARKVGLFASIKLQPEFGLSTVHAVELPNLASLFALGIALRL